AAAKDAEIQTLRSKIEQSEVARKLAVTEALNAVEKERDALQHALAKAQQEQESAIRLAEAKLVSELQKAAATREAEIQVLKAQLEQREIQQQLAVSQALSKVERERDDLRSGLQRVQLEKDLAERNLKERYE